MWWLRLVMKRNLLIDSTSLSSGESQFSSTECIIRKERGGKIYFAVTSGIFATVGSLFGKLAGGFPLNSILGVLLKGLLLILMVTSNTVGCTFFVKALNASGSSLPCTIASAATSYVCSALAGSLIFNESTSLCWWCGISFVMLGLLLICHAPSKSDSMPSMKKSKEE